MRAPIGFIAVLIVTTLTACKDKPQQVSNPKDFAYSATAKNFAVMAGFSARNDIVQTDIANWENLLNREQLGKFTPVYIEKTNATVAKLKAAFKMIGSQMTADSTIVFAYSGPGKSGQLVADKEFTYEDLAMSLQEGLSTNKQVKKAKRFYLFIETEIPASDAATADDQLEKVFTNFNAAEKKQSAFEEALIFSSVYVAGEAVVATATPNNAGRFTFEFVKSLDLNIQKIRAGGERPTLRTFFDTIVAEVGKNTGRKSSYRLKPDALQKESLFPATFVPPLEPTPPVPNTTPSPIPAVVQPSAHIPPLTTPAQPLQPAVTSAATEVFNLPIQSETAQTNLKDQFKGNMMLLEVSASWCGPCQSLAGTIAGRTQNNASITSGKCTSAALLVNDRSSNLDQWKSMTSPQIASHSFIGGDSSVVKQWLSRLSGTPVTIEFFPTLFLVDSAGQVQSVGSEQALNAFIAACP